MTTFDLSPLFRTSVGFDRLFSLLDAMESLEERASGYPPYNIEKTDDNAYRITIAVAGFAPDELTVECRENELVVTGEHKDGAAEGADGEGRDRYLYRGIAGRAFRRVFQLADYVEAVGARLENGLLHIDLVREVPEAMKPRRIEIQTSAPARIAKKAKKLVESVKKAA